MPNVVIEAVGDTFLDVFVDSLDYVAPPGSNLVYEILDQPNGNVISTGTSPLPPGPVASILSNITPLQENRTYWWSVTFVGPSAEVLYRWGGWFSTYSSAALQDVSTEGDGGVNTFRYCGDTYDTANDDNYVRVSWQPGGYGQSYLRPATRGRGAI